MYYKPLLLALMLCFTAPAFAAKDAPKKEKAAAVKTKKERAQAAEKSNKKPNKKAAARPEAERKPAQAKRAEKAVKEVSDGPKAKKTAEPAKDRRARQAEKNDEARTAKKSRQAEPKNNRPSEKNDKNNDKKADTQNWKRADKTGKKGNVKNADERRVPDKKADAQNDARKAAERQAERAPAKSEAGFRDAVTAAANDLEAKKALNRRAGNLLVRVSGNLSQSRSNLAQINRRQRDAWDKLQQAATDLSRLQAEVANTRAQIARFVAGSYKSSQPQAVTLFLKNAEPGQKARFLRYTRYIHNANQAVVKDLDKQQKALAAQESRIGAELGRLKKLQAGAQASLRKQGAGNIAEQAESRRQNAKMAADTQKMAKRKENEQRLNKLLEELNKRKAEQRKREAEARKKAAEARLAAAEKARKAAAKKAEQDRAAMSTLTSEDMTLKAPAFVPISSPNSFSRMQGRLKKPVAGGAVAGMFGQDRGEGEVWKGVFYATPPAPVTAIAAGMVMYAGELEGYGKVVVVDHGDHYVSVYSGLSQTAVAEGYNIAAGHNIGTSGTLPSGEQGLYLEIRYNGQNMNPQSWIN
ncbi:peptidoglycan DD-metalloendopeptidase family protein [Neisseria chenwenguii]|uniref:peptidoglycan DD-metalloendopeptidase family protein n=1 Tax=Neisseria chenwenguii TaxID=1853278 RepID=UPI000F4E420E|nr:peptidoglycan DD-metalloendopeptidase family protein [Neisseria chenwenguii]ROV55397.1 hypothetical protein EGS38_10145 [Neisseria chenwenguii]